MYKQLVAACLAIALLTGCGGPAGVAFGTDGLPIAKLLNEAVKQKKTDQVDQIIRRAKQMREKKTIRSDELATLEKIIKLMKAGEWEKAQELSNACIEMSERGK